MLKGRSTPADAEALAFFRRYAPRVERVLAGILGADPDLPDLIHDVFVRALGARHTVRNPMAMDAWVTQIAVFSARSLMSRRRRWRWLVFVPSDELPEVALATATPEDGEALARTYAILARLSADDRIAFALRFVAGMELTEVADACGVSLATIKRRLARAQERFIKLAARDPMLQEWIARGRWAEEATS